MVQRAHKHLHASWTRWHTAALLQKSDALSLFTSKSQNWESSEDWSNQIWRISITHPFVVFEGSGETHGFNELSEWTDFFLRLLWRLLHAEELKWTRRWNGEEQQQKRMRKDEWVSAFINQTEMFWKDKVTVWLLKFNHTKSIWTVCHRGETSHLVWHFWQLWIKFELDWYYS